MLFPCFFPLYVSLYFNVYFWNLIKIFIRNKRKKGGGREGGGWEKRRRRRRKQTACRKKKEICTFLAFGVIIQGDSTTHRNSPICLHLLQNNTGKFSSHLVETKTTQHLPRLKYSPEEGYCWLSYMELFWKSFTNAHNLFLEAEITGKKYRVLLWEFQTLKTSPNWRKQEVTSNTREVNSWFCHK